MATIRTGAIFLNRTHTISAAGALPELVRLDDSKFSPAATCYLEVIGSVSGSSESIQLREASGGTSKASITISSSSLTRYRSTSFTLDSGVEDYYLYAVSGNSGSITAARVVIIQTGTISSLETQHEIGSFNNNLTATSQTAIPEPKYWRYDSANWDGTVAFYVDISYLTVSDSKTDLTVILQEDNGSFGSWTDKLTVLSAVNSVVYTLARSGSFTPTNGRHYRLSYYIGNNMYAAAIYNAKIIVQQSGSPTKFETSYQLISQAPSATGRVDQWNRFDPTSSEWDGVSVSWYNEHSCDGTSRTTSIYKDDSGWAEISGSSVSGANRARSSAITMPAGALNIDGYAGNGSSVIYGSRLIGVVTISSGNNYTISGSVTVSVSPAATLDYTMTRSLAGAVSVPTTIAATMLFNRNEVLAGDVTVPVSVAATLEFNKNYTLAGAVTIPSTIAATLEFNRNEVLAGAVTIPITVAATMEFTGQNQIIGDVTVPVSVAATMDYTLNRTISGAVTVPLTVNGSPIFNRNEVLTGDVTVPITVAAGLSYNINPSLSGAVTVPFTVAATLTVGWTITGAVNVPISVTAGLSVGWTITGAVTVPITIAALMEAAGQYQITGDVTVPITVAATMDYNLNRELAGAVTVPITVASTLLFNHHESLSGAVAVPISITSSLAFNRNEVLAGSVTVPVSIAAGMVYEAGTADYVIAGSITVPISVNSTLIYNLNAVLLGSVTVPITPASTMLFEEFGLPGIVTLTTLAPAALLAALAPVASLADLAAQAELEDQP